METAASGRKAMQILPILKPDIVLLDVSMPEQDGFDLCKILKADPLLRFTKVIFVSGQSSVEDRLLGYKVGGDDYIVKPFNNEELISKVRVMSRLKAIEEVDCIKNDFITLIAHETRSPISVIQTAVDLLSTAQFKTDPEKIGKILGVVGKSVKRLSELAEKTMLVCKLKSLKMIPLAKTSVRILLSEVKGDLVASAKEQAVTIDTEIDEAYICADRDLVGLAFQYIIENAIKFSPSGGTVSIKSIQKNERYVTQISDDGQGMSQERLGEIFTNFAVADIMHHKKGLGLSMALISRIVELHNGQFTIESKIGVGTVCTVELPLFMLDKTT